MIPHFTPVGIAMRKVGWPTASWGFYSYDLECLLPCEYQSLTIENENTLVLIRGTELGGRMEPLWKGTLFAYDLRTGNMTELGQGAAECASIHQGYQLDGSQQTFYGMGNSGPMWLSQLPSSDGPLGLQAGGDAFSAVVFNRDRDVVLNAPPLEAGRQGHFSCGWDGRIIHLKERLEDTTVTSESAHSIYSGRGRFLFRRDHVQYRFHILAGGQYFAIQEVDESWGLVDFSGNPVALPAGTGEIRGNCVRWDRGGGYECCTDNNHLLIVDGLGILRVPELAPQPSEWAAADTAEAVELGLVDEDIRWWWQDSCTREEFCRILVHGLERITGKTAAELTEGLALPEFSDCDSEAVRTAAALGIVQGVGQEKFAPIRFVRRHAGPRRPVSGI